MELNGRLKSSIKALQKHGYKARFRYADLERNLGKESIETLEEAGFVEQRKKGYISFRWCAWQPLNVIKHILPSLNSLKDAAYFEGDPLAARPMLGDNVTLDYKAWELTNYQTPAMLCAYADNMKKTCAALKKAGFEHDGKDGRICILPKNERKENAIEQVYYDSLASGGRSLLDAAALQLLYPDQIREKAKFSKDIMNKVRDELSQTAS